MAAALAVAVTGDVGAGKSTVSRLLKNLFQNCIFLDADVLTKELWRRGDVIQAAADRWGRENIMTPSGDISYGAVAERVFASQPDYQWCCGLLHPLVLSELERRVSELDASQQAVMEIPLLFEAGRSDWVTQVVFVTAPRDIRLERCRERDWDAAELERREKFFLPSEERMKMSDFVLNNDGNLAALENKIRGIKNILKVF